MATFSRIKAPIACAIVLAAVLACGVMWIPDYGKDIYSETKAVDYDEYKDQTGFPAGNGYEELTKVEEIINTDYGSLQYLRVCIGRYGRGLQTGSRLC